METEKRTPLPAESTIASPEDSEDERKIARDVFYYAKKHNATRKKDASKKGRTNGNSIKIRTSEGKELDIADFGDFSDFPNVGDFLKSISGYKFSEAELARRSKCCRADCNAQTSSPQAWFCDFHSKVKK